MKSSVFGTGKVCKPDLNAEHCLQLKGVVSLLTLFLPLIYRIWLDPGPWVQFHGIPGALGRFLGFFSVLMNAAFVSILSMPKGMKDRRWRKQNTVLV
jgi:hypothetical protein